MDKSKQPLRESKRPVRKSKQPLRKPLQIRIFKDPFDVPRSKESILRDLKKFLTFIKTEKRFFNVQTKIDILKSKSSFLTELDILKSKGKLLRKSRLKPRYLTFRSYLFLRREFLRKYSRYSKYRIRIRKRFFRSRRFFIRSKDQIHYKKMSVIGRFIGYQGKIIPRRVTRLTLRQQRLMTTAIKKARILGFLPFLNNERYFRRVRWRQILKRRHKRRSRKTRYKKKPRGTRLKDEPRGTRPQDEPRGTRLKNETRTTGLKNEPGTAGTKTRNS